MQRRARSEYICKIDFVFYNEGKIRLCVREARVDPAPSQKTSMRVLAFSDPTSRQAIRNASPVEKIAFDGHVLEKPEQWLMVIEKTYAWADELTREIARERYRGEGYRQICEKVSVAQTTFYERLRKFRRYAAMQAIALRLITM